MKRAVNKKKSSKFPHEKLFCNYVHRICMQNRLEGYDYCIRHILEDKAAPFRQCSYVHSQTGKRCTNAAPKTDKRDSLCPWHVKRAFLSSRLPVHKKKHSESPQTLLAALEHHCSAPYHDISTQREPFTRNGNLMGLNKENDIGEIEISSLEESLKVNTESDAESVDSDYDEPLKHAGVYTPEEVASITRDKLIRLQSLYIDQFKRLQHVLREKRRNYLHSQKVEKETSQSTSESPTDNIVPLENLKALRRYHQCFGKEALLKLQAYERRKSVTEGSSYQSPHFPKCIYSHNGQKCLFRSLPLSKYCLKHILADPLQVLYKKCNTDIDECKTPVVPYSENAACLLHSQLPTSPVGQDQTTWNSIAEQVAILGAGDIDILVQEPEHFQSMDDIASLGLDVVQPGCLFGLNQFGEPGESTDSVLSDHPDLMQQSFP